MSDAFPEAVQPEGGMFITFEGGEGSGKSTQAALLTEVLREEGYDVLETHEPGGSPGGAIVREVLLGGHAADKGPLAEACLLTSARKEHVDLVIKPALERNQIVICDRYADSTRIYQGYVGGVPAATIDQLETVATGGLMPKTTFVLDVSQSTAAKRRAARHSTKNDADDRFEREDDDFHAKVNAGFLRLCEQYPQRCFLIDGNDKPTRIATTIRDSLRLRGLV